MYRCEYCQQLQAAGISSVLVPVETRVVTYPFREDALPPLPKKQGDRTRRRRTLDRRDDPGGTGYETVRERRCCPTCAAKADRPEPTQEPVLSRD